MLNNLKNKRRVIVLFNLGGPNNKQSIKPFLFNLFNDEYIITLPRFLRYLIAKFICWKRKKTAEKIYSYLGGKSPILDETSAQALSISDSLDSHFGKENYKIFICMRHWHPMSKEVVADIVDYKPEEIISLPLYPQFSTTTTLSSIRDFLTKMQMRMPDVLYKTLCCYPRNTGLTKGYVTLIEESLQKIKNISNCRILFSAHGLPKRIIESGDPYQWQVETTVNSIMSSSNLVKIDYSICYQSKVGPLQWIGPSTEDEIIRSGMEQKEIIIVPISFVSEHSETLVELDIEYKEIANQFSVNYVRVPTLRVNAHFIDSLKDIIISLSDSDVSILSSDEMKRICPSSYTRCPCK